MARRANITKYEIIQVASGFFFDVGYNATSPKMIAEELEISTGNITYYFPTKEHLLAVIVEMLCDFQWKMLGAEADMGIGSVGSICVELMTVASACAENEIAKEFFTAVFQSELCRNYLRNNHVERAKKIFAEECAGYTDEQFQAAEILVQGLQYSTIITTDINVPLAVKIRGALELILSIYNVSEETRKREIEKVLSMDSRGISKQVLKGFVSYVEKTNESTLNDLIKRNRRKSSHADEQ